MLERRKPLRKAWTEASAHRHRPVHVVQTPRVEGQCTLLGIRHLFVGERRPVGRLDEDPGAARQADRDGGSQFEVEDVVAQCVNLAALLRV